MKYSWSCAGQVILALPILLSLTGEGDGAEAVGQRTRMYTTAKNYLIDGGDAAERLMTSYKEIVELAGYTSRVSDMFKIFNEVKNGNYVMTNAVSKNGKFFIQSHSFICRTALKSCCNAPI